MTIENRTEIKKIESKEMVRNIKAIFVNQV